MLKRYLLFVGDDYYPAGGWEDFQGPFEFISEAREAAQAITPGGVTGWSWSHIIDSTTGLKIADDEVDPPGEDIDDQMEARAELESDPPPDPERIAELRAKLDATKLEPQGLNAALVARAFEVMLPKHGPAHLSFNPHHTAGHEDIDSYLEHFDAEWDWVSPVEHQKAKALDDLWLFYWNDGQSERGLAAATLPAIAQWLEDNGLAFGS